MKSPPNGTDRRIRYWLADYQAMTEGRSAERVGRSAAPARRHRAGYGGRGPRSGRRGGGLGGRGADPGRLFLPGHRRAGRRGMTSRCLAAPRRAVATPDRWATRIMRPRSWSLTHALAEPEQAGIGAGRRSAARRTADSVAGWPDGPLTEESVAWSRPVLRWHGERIIGRLPFWVMGWIFVRARCRAVAADRSVDGTQTGCGARCSEPGPTRCVDRVAQTWAAAHQAGQPCQGYWRWSTVLRRSRPRTR